MRRVGDAREHQVVQFRRIANVGARERTRSVIRRRSKTTRENYNGHCGEYPSQRVVPGLAQHQGRPDLQSSAEHQDQQHDENQT